MLLAVASYLPHVHYTKSQPWQIHTKLRSVLLLGRGMNTGKPFGVLISPNEPRMPPSSKRSGQRCNDTLHPRRRRGLSLYLRACLGWRQRETQRETSCMLGHEEGLRAL